MRAVAVSIVAVTALMLAACGGDDGGADSCTYMGQDHPRGAVFPAGDGCNTCSCTDTGAECTLINCADQPDANPTLTCGPTGGCGTAPLCGAECCGTGEQCVDGECRCGDSPACTGTDHCESVGPLPESLCGSVCCTDNCPG